MRTGSLLVSADGGPLIGPLAGLPGIHLNTGYGGHGVMMSPEGARRLAGMIAGDAPAANPFAPARFAEGAAPPPAEPMTVNLSSERGPR